MQEFFSFFYRVASGREKQGENGSRGGRALAGEGTGVFGGKETDPDYLAAFIAASKM